jgi:Alcohol dehydrogenase GroES-like domain
MPTTYLQTVAQKTPVDVGSSQVQFQRPLPITTSLSSISPLLVIMSTRIPETQRAAVIKVFGQDLVLETNHPVKQRSELAPGECLIKLEYAGVCHSDLHAKRGDLKRMPTPPRIGGHEVSSEPLSSGG